jgi:hypothetical protein
MFISNQTSSINWSSAPTVSRSNNRPSPEASRAITHPGEQAVLSDTALVMQAQGQLGRDWSGMLGNPNGTLLGPTPDGPYTNWIPTIPDGPFTNWPTPLEPGTNMPTLPDPGTPLGPYPGRPTNRLPRVPGPGTRPGGPFTNWPGIEGPGRPAGPFTNWPEERLVRR